MSADSRYLAALAVVTDVSSQVEELDQVVRSAQATSRRTAPGFNPIAKDGVHLFRAAMDGPTMCAATTRRGGRSGQLGYLLFAAVTDEQGEPMEPTYAFGFTQSEPE